MRNIFLIFFIISSSSSCTEKKIKYDHFLGKEYITTKRLLLTDKNELVEMSLAEPLPKTIEEYRARLQSKGNSDSRHFLGIVPEESYFKITNISIKKTSFGHFFEVLATVKGEGRMYKKVNLHILDDYFPNINKKMPFTFKEVVRPLKASGNNTQADAED